MRTITISVTITRDNGTTQSKPFNWTNADDVPPQTAFERCADWGKEQVKGEAESIAKAPKPAPYKSKGMNS